MRADRLLALLLLLQSRGRTTAATLADELEVSVRTIYRDLEALGAAGFPVYAQSGHGGGCQLVDGYRTPLTGLTAEEAAALLILGVPQPLRDLGLGNTLSAAQRHVRVATGVPGGGAPHVHLDMPRWFHAQEATPHLATLADGIQRSRRLAVTYQAGGNGRRRSHVLGPLGLVNKAGVWYLVASTPSDRTSVFRAARIVTAEVTADRVDRPAGFDLAAFWEQWSAEFQASRPRLSVTVRASPAALAAMPEVFGDGVREALAAAGEPDAGGWRRLTLTFEHVGAAVHRLAGFGGLIEVESPPAVRDRLVAVARATLERHTGS